MTVYELNKFQAMSNCTFGKMETALIFKHIHTLKPTNKHTIKPKNVLPKPLCKKSFTKFKLIHPGPQLSNNNLLEAVTINLFKTHTKYLCI